MKTLSGLFFPSLVALSRAAVGPTAKLHIINKHIAPDGFNRSSVLVDGVFPAPLIRGNKGDTFSLDVFNELNDSTMPLPTSIHWHGLFQNGTNWADGPSMVTQCPIVPGESFHYRFKARDQAGTFWYHSHFGTQYCDGLRGPLVVYDPHDPHRALYDVDNESTVLTLGDWYHFPSPQLSTIPEANSTLINGHGRSNDSGPDVRLAVVNVEHGKRYRMRLVNIACDPNYNFTIQGHTMTIIEADGENTRPLEVDSIQIFAGQRYSFILHADQTIGNYWIMAKPSSNLTPPPPPFANNQNSAILRYKGAPAIDPPTPQMLTSKHPLLETNLRPLTDPEAPGTPGRGNADKPINLHFDFNTTTRTFSINGVSFNPNAAQIPVLLQILSGKKKAHELLPPGSVMTLPRNKVVELSMPGSAVAAFGGPHPLHLHGHSFSVVRSAASNCTDDDPDTCYDYTHPVRRDVVSIGNGPADNVTIRFRTDNPGPWFLHCHIDWHLATGFAFVFAEDPGETKLHNPVPDEWFDLCPAYQSFNASNPGQVEAAAIKTKKIKFVQETNSNATGTS